MVGLSLILKRYVKNLIIKSCAEGSKYSEIDLTDFSRADLNFFNDTRDKFAALGFEYIADFVRVIPNAGAGNVEAPSRYMLSSCGSTRLLFHKYKYSGALGLLVSVSEKSSTVTEVSCSTKFNNGHSIFTTDATVDVKKRSALGGDICYVAKDQDPEKIYLWHRSRVASYLSSNPSVEVVSASGVDEFFRSSLELVDAMRREWAKTNYKVSQVEAREQQRIKHKQNKFFIIDEMLNEPVDEKASPVESPSLPISPVSIKDDGVEWFHSMKGQQYGPVTLGELRGKIEEGEVTGVDLAWHQGMGDWSPVSLVPELAFEKKKKKEDVYKPSPVTLKEISRAGDNQGVVNDLYDQPGIKRLGFWLIGVPAFTVNFLSYELSALLGGAVSTSVISWTGWIILVIAIGSRIKNLAMHTGWFWVILVPFLNFWLGYRLCCCPPGYAEHKKLGAGGIILSVIYWGGLVVSLGVLVVGLFMPPELLDALESGGLEDFELPTESEPASE